MNQACRREIRQHKPLLKHVTVLEDRHPKAMLCYCAINYDLKAMIMGIIGGI